MANAVEICSNALLMLGAQPIASFEEATDRARLASNLWPLARDAFMRSHAWNPLVHRVTLAADSSAPEFDYAYKYLLPSDWLRTLSVGEDGLEPDWRHEGRYILCDDTPLLLRYIRSQPESAWDSMMTQGMVLAMQAAMAYGITQSASVRDSALNQLSSYMKQCRAVDGQDDPPQTLGDFRLLASRFGASR